MHETIEARMWKIERRVALALLVPFVIAFALYTFANWRERASCEWGGSNVPRAVCAELYR